MKQYKEWTIIKALNRNENLAVCFTNNTFKLAIAFCNDSWVERIRTEAMVTLDNVYDLKQFLLNIEKVMNRHSNNLSVVCDKSKSDITLRFLENNPSFKVQDSLKLELRDPSGKIVTKDNITLSKESAKNLYRAIMIAIEKYN